MIMIVIVRTLVLVFDGTRPLKPQEMPMRAPVRMKMDVAAVTVKYTCAHLRNEQPREKHAEPREKVSAQGRR